MDEAFKWLWKASKVMFYCVSPWELALGDDDPAPTYFLRYGLPMFFVMIFVEWVIILLRDSLANSKPSKSAATTSTPWPLSGYRLNDFLASVTSGSFQLVGLLMVDLAGLGVVEHSYSFVFDHFRVFTVDSKANVWLAYFALLLGKDVAYYWAHRTMHEWHGMWVGHSVHHSGEDYNLATALRQGLFQPLVGWPFYLPLALLGFHPKAFSAHNQLNTMYMFWVHTDLVGRLPLGLEYVLNSPASHRMHHRPPGNCNYAGTFIVWDRLFGTYAPELVRRDLFGLAESPKTFDPLKLNTNHLRRMACNVNATPNSTPSNFQSGGDAQQPSSSFSNVALFLRRAVKRRVPAKWVLDPAALFSPIPPEKADLRRQPPMEPTTTTTSRSSSSSPAGKGVASEGRGVGGGGGGRPKWDGAHVRGFGWSLAAAAAGLVALLAALVLTVLAKKAKEEEEVSGSASKRRLVLTAGLHTGDAMLIGALLLASQSSLGRLLDQCFAPPSNRGGGGGVVTLRAASELAVLLPSAVALFAVRPVESGLLSLNLDLS